MSTEPIARLVRDRAPGGWPAGGRLWIVAIDYATGERVVFGRPGSPATDLATAVAASCAIPSFYRPVGATLVVLEPDGRSIDLIGLNPMSRRRVEEVGVAAAAEVRRYLSQASVERKLAGLGPPRPQPQ